MAGYGPPTAVVSCGASYVRRGPGPRRRHNPAIVSPVPGLRRSKVRAWPAAAPGAVRRASQFIAQQETIDRALCRRGRGRVENIVAIAQTMLVPDTPILEKVLRPILVYGFLIVLLRFAGQRTLTQMNTFDLIVLLTLSNTVQNAIIGPDNSVVGGMIGAATLVAINVLVVRYLYRHPTLDRAIEGEPIVLVQDGVVIRRNVERVLITTPELMAALRRQGVENLADVEEVVLETSGAISVIPRHPTDAEQREASIVDRLDRIESLLRQRAAPPAGQDSQTA